MGKTQVRFWHKRFREGEMNTADKPRCGRPRSQRTAENIDKVQQLIQDDPRMPLKELAVLCDMSTHAVRCILKKDLKMKRHCAKFIPKVLTEPQKWTRMTVCDDNIKLLCNDPDPNSFVKRIITGDETWISTYEPDTKRNSTAWTRSREECPRKALRNAFDKKTMMTVFFDCKGVIMCEFLPPRQTVTLEWYVATLSNLKVHQEKKT